MPSAAISCPLGRVLAAEPVQEVSAGKRRSWGKLKRFNWHV